MRIEENMGECLIIRTGGGTDTTNANATAGVVLSGYSCYVNEQLITGTMTNRGSIGTQTLSPGGSYTIPGGWHNGAGKVSVGSLSSATSADAGAANVLSGYTGWVNGTKITGTMTNRGAVSQALAANGSYTIPAGWHNGSGKVTQSLTTQAAVSITPGRAKKTACAANRWTTGNIVILGSSALTAGNIKKDKIIFGVTGTSTGGEVDLVNPLWLVDDYLLPYGNVVSESDSRGASSAFSVETGVRITTNGNVRAAQAYSYFTVWAEAMYDIMDTWAQYWQSNTAYAIQIGVGGSSSSNKIIYISSYKYDVTFTKGVGPGWNWCNMTYTGPLPVYTTASSALWYFKGVKVIVSGLNVPYGDAHRDDLFGLTITDLKLWK